VATVFAQQTGAAERVVEVSAPVLVGQAVIYTTPVAGQDRVIPATNTTEIGSYVVGIAKTSQAVIGGLVTIVKLGSVPGILGTVAPPAAAGVPIFLGPAGETLRFSQVAGPPVAVVRLGYASNIADLDVDIEWIGWRP